MSEHPYEEGRADRTTPRSWRTLPRELLGSEDVPSLVRTVQHYGWLPPAIGFLLHGLARGLFEHLTDPTVVSSGYWFPGWPGALLINLVFGTFIVMFAYFMYFGVIGAFAGMFSESRDMHEDVFKVAGYLSVVWVPLFAVAWLVALTLGAGDVPDPATTDTSTLAGGEGAAVYDTLQLQIVGVLKGVGWAICGFVLLPVIATLYDIDARESVAAVLPVTIAAIVAAQIV